MGPQQRGPGRAVKRTLHTALHRREVETADNTQRTLKEYYSEGAGLSSEKGGKGDPDLLRPGDQLELETTKLQNGKFGDQISKNFVPSRDTATNSMSPWNRSN